MDKGPEKTFFQRRHRDGHMCIDTEKDAHHY